MYYNLYIVYKYTWSVYIFNLEFCTQNQNYEKDSFLSFDIYESIKYGSYIGSQ